MIYREITIADIPEIMEVRFAVKENTLSNPDLVTSDDCMEFITQRGKGWVCEIDGRVIGFSIVDMRDLNIWALFIDPDFEKKGIGRKLHDMMLDWYFDQTRQTVWLSTSPKTRAESFYKKAGWTEVGIHGNDIKFEMTFENWNNRNIKIESR